MRVLGRPVEGADSSAAELALLFAEAAAGHARTLVRVHSLDASIAEAVAKIAEGVEELENARVRHADAASMLQSAGSTPVGTWTRLFPLVLAVSGVLFLGLAIGAGGGAAALGFILGAAGVGLGVYKRGEETKSRSKQLAELNSAASSTEQRVREVDSSLAQWRARHDSLVAERKSVVMPPKVKAVGRVYLPVQVLDVAGYPILVDGSGSAEKVPLRLPDLAAQPQVVERVRNAVRRAHAKPMLLTGGGKTFSGLKSLVGEEHELHEAIESFTHMLKSIPVLEENLPLVPRDGALARFVENEQKNLVEQEFPGTIVRGSDEKQRGGIKRIAEMAHRLRSIGSHVDAALRELHGDMQSVLEAYGALRSSALERMHLGLQNILSRSDLPYVTFYCPKCNRVPAYLFHRLGIDIDLAHELAPSELLNALQEDPETRERLVKDEQILIDISQSWSAIQELGRTLDELKARQIASAQELGADMGAMRAFESRLRALIAQRSQMIEQFRAGLRKAVTGNPRPLLEFSKRARLLLDPRTRTWTCAMCNTTFEDPEVASMGRMLKVKDELLMPMWNHLWTEKDDFRKSELFRTNEQIQRLIEKETVALREVSEQYRADMRPVRENLILATSEATSKREQLDATVSSLVAIGVVDEAEASKSTARIESITGGDLASHRKRAEAKETLLNQEPQAQMNRRIPAIDPISMLLTPEALFKSERTVSGAVTLPALPASKEAS